MEPSVKLGLDCLKADLVKMGVRDVPSVLIVEDDEVDRELLRALLGQFECTVDEAESGEEALAKVKSQRPDLTFVDIRLPHLDGIEVTEQGKGFSNFILVSGAVDANVESRAIKSGAAVLLSKPVTPEQVAIILKRKP